MGMIRYDAVDLPRRDGVVVAYLQHGKPTLETCPYEVIWDGTSSRPLGRQLALPEEKPRPRPAVVMPEYMLRDTWQDLPEGSTAHIIAFFLNDAGPATVSEIVEAVGFNRHRVSESLYRLRAKGFTEVVSRKPRRDGPPIAVWSLVE